MASCAECEKQEVPVDEEGMCVACQFEHNGAECLYCHERSDGMTFLGQPVCPICQVQRGYAVDPGCVTYYQYREDIEEERAQMEKDLAGLPIQACANPHCDAHQLVDDSPNKRPTMFHRYAGTAEFLVECTNCGEHAVWADCAWDAIATWNSLQGRYSADEGPPAKPEGPSPSQQRARKSIGKGLRYDVFERDGFTCQYCGQQPPDVTLVVDHIIPVAEGGGNEIDNLRTACFDCNAGKSAKLPTNEVVNERDRLARAQEGMEAIALAKSTKRAREANEQLRSEAAAMLEVHWDGDPPTSLVSLVVNRIKEAGAEEVVQWMDSAATHLRYHGWNNIGKYLSGCARRWREQQEENHG